MALVRNINAVRGTAIAITMVIGSGLFGLPGLAIDASDNVTAIIAWAVVALSVAPIIHIFSRLGQSQASEEGVVGFATAAIGGWSRGGFSLIAAGALAVGMPAFFLVIGAYCAELLGLAPAQWTGTIAILFVWLATLLNAGGMRNVGIVNQLVVVLVLGFVIGVVMTAGPSLQEESARLFNDVVSHAPDIGSLWASCVIIFWAFQGWENLSFGLGEFENPKRTVPLVFWCSFAIIVILYLSFAWVISAAHYAGIHVSGLSGLTALLGGGWTRLAVLAAMIVILFANANSWVFGASRAFYSAARIGVLPALLHATNDRGIPVRALYCAAALYTSVIVAMEMMDIPAVLAFQLTTQGFIILYGASIIAYLRMDGNRPAAWIIAAAAAIGWVFLMHGFSSLLLYPAILFLISLAVQACQSGGVERQTAERKPATLPD